jgi:hypothetical protein
MLTLFTNKESEAHALPQDNLEDVMMELLRYGQPRVGVYSSNGTWSCHIEMNTMTVGSDFTVRSDHGMPTPLSAAKQCLERVTKAVAVYKAIA